MDRLEELRIFQAISETRSLTQAATKVGVSPATVSRALTALEERSGVRLVERNTRRVSLTAAGRDMSVRAISILGDYDEAINNLDQGLLRGLLRITAPVQFGRLFVTPFVTQFLERNPELEVDIVLDDRYIDVIEQRIDAAVRIGVLPDSDMVARKVGEVRRVHVASPQYLAERGTPQTPTDLVGHNIIFGTRYDGKHEWIFGGLPNGQSLGVPARLSINDVESVLVAARAGHGVARILSYQAIDDLARGSLIRVLREYEVQPLPIHVLMPSTRHIPRRQRVFIEELSLFLLEDPKLRIAAL
ncbi:LysR family transcriptional regulator [Rhizobium tropici]|uniref:HTH-type transcriptional regulator TtuA n=1 Tax=Rhizobium tropici TaxID=398 RepID=A0A5B0W823_RHITR|nr:LysR family transcriptional regulator [Rhizobium tropici]KAA1183064.1 LysR family transcriptional regulator [Rhizobium tropici]